MYVQKKEILQPELQLLGSAQAHTPHFKKHDLKIYKSCEYCHEFICKWCAKIDHKDHDWKTIPTAGEESYEEESK